jgi:putative hydrolase of the HAD superfamily
MNKDIQLIWDFDDTIVKTSVEFDKTNHITAEIISNEVFSVLENINDIKSFQRSLDMEMVSELGFLPKRYLMSWLLTYEHFLTVTGKRAEKRTKEKIVETVMDVYDRQYDNIPESIPVLKGLKNEGYKMIILTAGEEDVQKRKVEQSGAIDYVDDIYVFSKKTPQTLKTVMEKYRFTDYVMIGNSLKSDIYPALENNAWGFHYEQATWEADQYNINKNHEKYVHLSSLNEVPVKLDHIFTKGKSLAI